MTNLYNITRINFCQIELLFQLFIANSYLNYLIIIYYRYFYMFSERLQNPFLKSSHFANTISHPTHTYDSSLFPHPKYKDYFTSFQQPKLNGYSSFQPFIYQSIDTSHKDKTKDQPNLGQILSKNPFNRSFTSILHSKVNADLSPNKQHSNWNSQSSRTHSYTINSNSPYFQKSYQIGLPVRQNNFQVSVTNHVKLFHQRNKSNYQTGSSAQSCGTYINKINEFDGEKFVDHGNNQTTAINNPFYRKQLMQNRVYDKQAKPLNTYDSVALKNSQQNGEKDNKQIARTNYLEKTFQSGKIQKVKIANNQNILSEGQRQKMANQNRQQHLHISNPFPPKLQIKNNNLTKKEDNEYISKYLAEEGKYKKYYEGYDQDKKYSFGPYDNQYNFGGQLRKLNQKDVKETDQNEQFDFNVPDKFDANRLIGASKEGNVMKVENTPLLKNNLNAATLDQNNGFMTLGQGVPIGSSSLQGTGKFTHSHVEEYENPIQIQKKLMNHKINLQQEYIDRQMKDKFKRKSPSFGQEQQNKVDELFKQKANYPSTLVINGSVFHRLSVI